MEHFVLVDKALEVVVGSKDIVGKDKGMVDKELQHYQLDHSLVMASMGTRDMGKDKDMMALELNLIYLSWVSHP